MEKSAGLVIIYDKKILLVHPTRSSWFGTYSIPKGKVEKNESILEAAIRETYEETGLNIPISWIQDLTERSINYDKKGKVYKKVYYYIINLTEEQKNLLFGDTLIIPKENIQFNEIDWSGFLNLEDAKDKIFWRFTSLLDLIQ